MLGSCFATFDAFLKNKELRTYSDVSIDMHPIWWKVGILLGIDEEFVDP